MKLNKLWHCILPLILFLVPLGCEEIKHNTNFQREGNLWLLPSEMHDSLFVKIEFAQTDSEMMQGLMFRRTMNVDEGMLFIYSYSQEMNFWMKNTYIPLDLIFIDETGSVVDLHEGAKPFSEKNISSSLLSKFVLEVNAGFCEKNYIIIGDKVKWEKIKK